MFSFTRIHAGLCACLLACVIWTAPLSAKTGSLDADSNAERQQLSGLIAQILAENPEIQAAQAAVDAAKARLSGAALPLNNPELEVEAERTDIDLYTLGFSQTLDWHDKQSAFEQSAAAELSAVRAELEALRLVKAGELLDAVGGITTQHKITLLAKERSHVLKRFFELAEQRFKAGDIPQSELELARLSLIEAVMQHAASGEELIQAESDFFTLSGQTLNAGFKTLERLPAELPSLDEQEQARNHPKVQAAYQSAQAARQQIRATVQGRKADPTVAFRVGREDRENLIGLTLSIPLQVRNNFHGNVEAAQAEALQAEHEAQQAYQSLLARLKSAKKRYGLVFNAWQLWVSEGRGSLQQSIKLLESQWQTGEMSTTDYLLQVQQTLNTQIAGVELHGRLWSAWTEWLSASGTLFDWLNIDPKE